jgi:hypothetical protein
MELLEAYMHHTGDSAKQRGHDYEFVYVRLKGNREIDMVVRKHTEADQIKGCCFKVVLMLKAVTIHVCFFIAARPAQVGSFS